MRFLLVTIYLVGCASVCAQVVPPSPAGGGYFQIYAPGDHAYIRDHDDFDVNFDANTSFTIEMWVYQKRPMKELEPLAINRIESPEQWFLMNKTGSYTMGFFLDGITFSIEGSELGGSGGAEMPLNQWHYIAFMVEARYWQQVINTQLTGITLTGRRIFLGVLDSFNSLRIGGGVIPARGFPGGPFAGKPIWTPFTGGLIDEVRISNIIRYPKEKLDAELWKDTIVVPTGPFEPDEHTVALWHFDFDGTLGAKWLDASGNGHHLTYKGKYLSVEPTGKLPVIWGELKRR